MTNLVFLIPVALFLGGLSLVAFLWALRNGQYDDLDGAAERILLEPPEEKSRSQIVAVNSPSVIPSDETKATA